MEWQPIETAPRDGSELLGWFPYHARADTGGSVFVIRWNNERHHNKPKPHFSASGWAWGVLDLRRHQPTHWMPLPARPESAK
jgi:hypothetical protein